MFRCQAFWFTNLNLLLCLLLEISSFLWFNKLCLGFYVGFLKFCIFSSFFFLDWFFMVSSSLFKGAFTGSTAHLPFIVLKIWCNFFFVYHVGNLAWVRKRASGLFVQLQFFCDSFFIMFIDNWFDVCTAAITHFYIIPIEYFMVFMVAGKMLLD